MILGLWMTVVLAGLTALFLLAHLNLGAIALAVLTILCFGATLHRFLRARTSNL